VPQFSRESRQLGNEAPLNFVPLRSRGPFYWFGSAVKGRDKRPAGALDSSPEPRGICVLDEADDFIDVDNRRL
jgi:hypothetical protein